ncbi:MAG: FAD-binding oxidoreductase [Candidatus Bathyarchaeia archaeon]
MRDYICKKLRNIVGEDFVVTERNAIIDYLTDETCPAVRPEPAEQLILVKPKSAQEISSIVKLANEEKIPIFPRGAGTGLAGGAIPTKDGIILSLERLNKIIEIDTENLMAVVEAGVPFSKLNAEAEKRGLFFPPHPGEESAQMGGITACNAGGVRCVKYGVIRDFVKGMEVVLPTGEILTLGGKLLKNVTGYSLMHLLIGSGGTLGIITKIVVRLYPKPKTTASLLVSYNNRHEAIKTVPEVLRNGITPLAVEYMEKGLMESAARKIGKTCPPVKGSFILYIIIEGESEENVYQTAERIYSICQKHNAIDGLIETSKRKQEDLLAIRSNIYTSLKNHLIDVLDISLPIANLSQMFEALDDIAAKYGVRIPVGGHVADGNIHPHILCGDSEELKTEDYEKVKREIYRKTMDLGGVITGEHGIGKIRTRIMAEMLNQKEVEIMRAIKKVFDPNNILNPGAIIPDS